MLLLLFLVLKKTKLTNFFDIKIGLKNYKIQEQN